MDARFINFNHFFKIVMAGVLSFVFVVCSSNAPRNNSHKKCNDNTNKNNTSCCGIAEYAERNASVVFTLSESENRADKPALRIFTPACRMAQKKINQPQFIFRNKLSHIQFNKKNALVKGKNEKKSKFFYKILILC